MCKNGGKKCDINPDDRTCCKYCNFFKANRSYEETVENAKKICEFQGYILIKKEVLI